MARASIRDEHGRPNLRRLRNYGFRYGLALGGVVGVILAGPHFQEWPFFTSLGVILGCGIGAGVLGHLAIAMVYGSAASGFGVASCGSIGGSDSGGGDGGGDGGGGGD